VLPHDVEEAAILLMELSCGFIHSWVIFMRFRSLI
jgi:hypothetical protein